MTEYRYYVTKPSKLQSGYSLWMFDGDNGDYDMEFLIRPSDDYLHNRAINARRLFFDDVATALRLTGMCDPVDREAS